MVRLATLSAVLLLLFSTGLSVKRLILGGEKIAEDNALIWEKFFKTSSYLAQGESKCVSFQEIQRDFLDLEWAFRNDPGFAGLPDDEMVKMIQNQLDDSREAIIARMENNKGKIILITSGSGNPEESAKQYQEFWSRIYGVTNTVWVPLTPQRLEVASDPEWLKQVDDAQGVFIAGTNATVVIESLLNSPLIQKMQDRMDLGCLVLMSVDQATNALQTTPVITQGSSYDSLTQKPVKGYLKDQRLAAYRESGGLGFFHFTFLNVGTTSKSLQMLDYSLISALQQEGYGTDGVGIGDDTALEVTILTGRVIGRGGVYFYDISSPTIMDVKFSFLRHGDSYSFLSKDIVLPQNKVFLGKEESLASEPLPVSSNIFSNPEGEINGKNSFEAVARSLAMIGNQKDAFGASYETPNIYVIFNKTEIFQAWYERKEGASNEELGETVGFNGMNFNYSPNPPNMEGGEQFCPLKRKQQLEMEELMKKEIEEIEKDNEERQEENIRTDL